MPSLADLRRAQLDRRVVQRYNAAALPSTENAAIRAGSQVWPFDDEVMRPVLAPHGVNPKCNRRVIAETRAAIWG